MDREEIKRGLESIRSQYGSWSYDIPLPFGLWTNDREGLPHTRLKRIVQAVSDLMVKPLDECRVLDLASLDGLFPIEFAQQGCETVGVEIRDINYRKAAFAADAIGLKNLDMRQGDVRDISVETHGRFDAIICSGILYHLTAEDAVDLIELMYEMTNRAVIIDTQIALAPEAAVKVNDAMHSGQFFKEHDPTENAESKARKTWSSADNERSFWFTRPSLVNILSKAGFTSVYECFTPVHRNFGEPGAAMRNRVTFVAIKGAPAQLHTSPAANRHVEHWQEGELAYDPGFAIWSRIGRKLKVGLASASNRIRGNRVGGKDAARAQ